MDTRIRCRRKIPEMNSIYLISNASSDYHRNTLTHFENVFDNNTFTLPPGKWQIVLDTILLQTHFSNIPIIYEGPDIKIIEIATGNAVGNIKLPYQNYSLSSLVAEMNEQVKELNWIRFSASIISEEDALAYFQAEHPNYIHMGTMEVFNAFNNYYNRLKARESFIRVGNSQQYAIAINFKLAKRLGLIGNDIDSVLDYIITNGNIEFPNPIKFKAVLPKYIKVELTNTDCGIENEDRSIISVHAINLIDGTTHYKNFEQPHTGILTSNYIRSFKARILDDTNRQLRMGVGQPTILKMAFQPYNADRGEFTITVDSSKPSQNFPNNNNTKFGYSIDPPIVLNDDYVCALTSITFPTAFQNIPIESSHCFIKADLKNNLELTIDVRINIPHKYTNIHDLIDMLNQVCKVPTRYLNNVRITNYTKLLDYQFLQFRLIKEHGLDVILIRGVQNAEYNLPTELSIIFGSFVDSDRWIFTMPPPTDEVEKEFAQIKDNAVHDSERLGVTPGQLLFRGMNINALIPYSMFMYTNFTDQVLAGGRLTNLLHIIPIKASSRQQGHYVTEEVRHLSFIQVRHNVLDNLKFELLQADGRPIAFAKSDDNVIFTLKFMRKRVY